MRGSYRVICLVVVLLLSVSPGDAQESSLVVLPFDNLSGEATDDWIGVGIAETVHAGLVQQGAIAILDTPPLGSDADARTVGQRLGAGWVVGGSFQRVGDEIEIVARLVNVLTDDVGTTVTVDGAVDDIFGLQDRLVAELSERVAVSVSDAANARADDEPVAGVRTEGETVIPPGAAGVDRPVAMPAPAPDTQADDDALEALRVFLDCGGGCDRDYLRREITFVNYVRDRRDAQVHVLVTDENTGGGTQYTVDFIGLEQFEGNDVNYSYFESRTDTDDETRSGMAQVLRVGFLHYIIDTPLAYQIEIGTGTGLAQRPVMAQPEDDPWNFWVFRISTNARASGEASRTQHNYNGRVSANRTTEQWKIRVEGDASYSESVTELSSGDFTNIRTNNRFTGQVVKSLGEHWGASIRGGASSSTFVNQDLRLQVFPGIEFNVFPYSESSRRSLTFSYEVGMESFDYMEETIFGRTEESRGSHDAQITFDMEQPWGDSRVRANYSSYLHDASKYSASVFGDLSFRVVRGLSVNLSASTSLVRDQLYLAREDQTDEQILTEQRQLATDSRYRVSFGFSYTFGSIFNNVVNPRF